MSDALNMNVSPICNNNGEKYAYVEFKDEHREAEGRIPQCKIEKNNGFTEQEVESLEEYMKSNLTMLKKMAAEVNGLKAMMK